jgi:hypothetical protein
LKPRFLLPARRELIEAVQYYNAQRVRLGDEFRDEAWETIRRINKFPVAWHLLGGAIRRCQMHRFPYGVIYEVTAEIRDFDDVSPAGRPRREGAHRAHA